MTTVELKCHEKLDDETTPKLGTDTSAPPAKTGGPKRPRDSGENNGDNKRCRRRPEFFEPKAGVQRLLRFDADDQSHDPLDRTHRQRQFERVAATLESEDWFENFNAEATGFEVLGIGAYGKVYRCRLLKSGSVVAVKDAICGSSHHEPLAAEQAFADQGHVLVDKLEATIASFFSRRTLAQCPNLSICYGYQWGKARVNGDARRLVRSQTASLLMLSEAADDTLAARIGGYYRDDNIGAVFSSLIQCLMAMCVMSRYGVSHNDLLSKNVLVSDCAGDVAYTLPPDLTLSGRVLPEAACVAIRTNGVHVQLTDFGLASQREWLESHDGTQPLLDCDPRVAHWDLSSPSLHHYYYEHTPDKLRSTIPAGMKLESCEAEVSFVHPLRYTHLKDNERDVASLLSEQLYYLAERGLQNRTTRAARRYCTAVLGTLERHRPASSDEFIVFVSRVVCPRFVGNFAPVEDIFVRHDEVAESHCYQLPSKRAARPGRIELRNQLGRLPLFDEPMSADCALKVREEK